MLSIQRAKTLALFSAIDLIDFILSMMISFFVSLFLMIFRLSKDERKVRMEIEALKKRGKRFSREECALYAILILKSFLTKYSEDSVVLCGQPAALRHRLVKAMMDANVLPFESDASINLETADVPQGLTTTDEENERVCRKPNRTSSTFDWKASSVLSGEMSARAREVLVSESVELFPTILSASTATEV